MKLLYDILFIKYKNKYFFKIYLYYIVLLKSFRGVLVIYFMYKYIVICVICNDIVVICIGFIIRV